MTILFIISILLSLFYFGFILSIYFGLKKINSQNGSRKSELPSVTILIPFRNEKDNLERSIESMNMLDYDENKIEIYFINDNSTDDSIKIFNSTKKKNYIQLINLELDKSNSARKKKAILKGIENSNNDIIVTTDADCYSEKNWLKNLVNHFDYQTALVAGPVDLVVTSNLIGAFQRIEFAGLNLTAAGLISIGMPLICSAANLAYRREVFNEIGGFGKSIKYSSGDDDFLIQKIAACKKWKIKFAYLKSAKVFTEGKLTFREFLNQRARWASKGFSYESTYTVVLLILLFLFYMFIPIQIILVLFGSKIILVSLFLTVVLKLIAEYLVMNKGLNDLYEKSLLKYFLAAEIIQIPYIILSPLIGIFGKFSWKGRSLKK